MRFPSAHDWDLSAIGDAPRAARLSNTNGQDLVQQLADAIQSASEQPGGIRLGIEEASVDPNDMRSVVQFPVSPNLFDYFMNGRGGYRARYLVAAECGAHFNAQLVELLVAILADCIPCTVAVRRLSKDFEDLGAAECDSGAFLASLAPRLTKAWMCTALIQPSGGVTPLALGLEIAQIGVPQRLPWRTFRRDCSDAWIDLKGAFLGPGRSLSVQSMEDRSRSLNRTGEA
jgi:hypothetical protein